MPCWELLLLLLLLLLLTVFVSPCSRLPSPWANVTAVSTVTCARGRRPCAPPNLFACAWGPLAPMLPLACNVRCRRR